MDITTILTNPITWLILTVLHAACWAYAYGIVRRMRQRNRNHGQTAGLVVIGNSIVGVAAFAITWINSGLFNAVGILVLLLLVNIAAGLPMIIEYISDHLNTTSDTSDRSVAQRIIQQIEERLR